MYFVLYSDKLLLLRGQSKVTVIPAQAIKAYTRSEVMPPVILNPGTK
jgi:hypothetical protein